jgi:hypothetical protein
VDPRDELFLPADGTTWLHAIEESASALFKNEDPSFKSAPNKSTATQRQYWLLRGSRPI